MLNHRLTAGLIVASALAAIPALAGGDVDIANDHLLYFVNPSDASFEEAVGAGPEAFADDYDDSLLYFMQGVPDAATEGRSAAGTVDYSDPDEWAQTPDNYL